MGEDETFGLMQEPNCGAPLGCGCSPPTPCSEGHYQPASGASRVRAPRQPRHPRRFRPVSGRRVALSASPKPACWLSPPVSPARAFAWALFAAMPFPSLPLCRKGVRQCRVPGSSPPLTPAAAREGCQTGMRSAGRQSQNGKSNRARLEPEYTQSATTDRRSDRQTRTDRTEPR